MRVLMTGGTGFLGKALTKALLDSGHQLTVISRKPQKVHGPAEGLTLEALQPEQSFDAVINLAGAGIADQRWSARRKQELLHSRLHTTSELMHWIAQTPHKPRVLLSGSAIGWYGAQGESAFTESSPAQSGFTHDLCDAWEQQARQAESHGVRTVLLRTGVVLHPQGGALKKMLLPFLMGVGGRIGDGQQWMSWISRDDWVRSVLFLMQHGQINGPVNLTALQPVRNHELTGQLAQALHRPAWLPVPAGMLRLLMGEMSGLLLDSQRVLPQRLQAMGFEFQHPVLSMALSEMLPRQA